MKKVVNPTIEQFEEHLCRNSAECATVLGVGYSTYSQYKSNRAEMTQAMKNHIDVILRLPLDRLHELVKERLHGS